jgi:hypothetical protein
MSQPIRERIEEAFDYRGDVTITLRDGSRVEGYVFDRDETRLRLKPCQSRNHTAIAHADIAEIEFTGRDMAAGKSWEAWVRQYAEKRAAGLTGIALAPESLDE